MKNKGKKTKEWKLENKGKEKEKKYKKKIG